MLYMHSMELEISKQVNRTLHTVAEKSRSDSEATTE
jgi:hypothetical protein